MNAINDESHPFSSSEKVHISEHGSFIVRLPDIVLCSASVRNCPKRSLVISRMSCDICTVNPMIYVHGQVVCFVFVAISYLLGDSYGSFTYIPQGFFPGTETVMHCPACKATLNDMRNNTQESSSN